MRNSQLPVSIRAAMVAALCISAAACNSHDDVLGAGSLPTLAVVSGDGQVGFPGQELPDPLVVRVENERGKGIRGQIVNFRVVEGGGSVFAGVSITNRDGIARERWTLGPAGAQRVEARAVDPATGDALTFAVFTASFGDNQAPLVSAVAADPNPVAPDGGVELRATVSDATTGGSLIASAEFNLNGGAFTPMLAVDGAFDDVTETVNAAIAPLGIAGDYSVCVRATDAAGNVSEPACVVLVVTGEFLIGGSASGLLGVQCVLQNNGGDDLDLVADGPFSFATPLAIGSTYNVTVLSEPIGPKQTCTVSNGTGVVPGSNVTDIVVECTVDRPPCETFLDLGTVGGNFGSESVSWGDVGEAWVRVRIDDKNFGPPLPLGAAITLESPPGIDYDLDVYCYTCGGALAGSSTNGPGETDAVAVGWADRTGDDTNFVLIHVRYRSGSSGQPWQLSVLGNQTPISLCDSAP